MAGCLVALKYRRGRTKVREGNIKKVFTQYRQRGFIKHTTYGIYLYYLVSMVHTYEIVHTCVYGGEKAAILLPTFPLRGKYNKADSTIDTKRFRGSPENRTCPHCSRVFTSELGCNYHVSKYWAHVLSINLFSFGSS